MPTKLTKTTTKTESKKSKLSEKKSESKILEKKAIERKESTKKVVVKRRKTDLKPTKASAVAIVSQANRAKKKALIEKVANSDVVSMKKDEKVNAKIPLWVWIFFWCSLLLFCVSFYQAIIRPQIEGKNVVVDESVNLVGESVGNDWNSPEIGDVDEIVIHEDESLNQVEDENEIQWVAVPQSANDVIVEFFNRLSNRDFDWTFDLMTPALRGYADIRNHFSSVRMNPFLDWIEWWKVTPTNIQYIKSPSYWKDVYNFDLSYVLKSNQEKFEEMWEFGVNTAWDEPKISSIRCISSKCSYHPIFWPENFGLMK